MELKTAASGLNYHELIELNFSKNDTLRILFLEDLESDAELVQYYIGELAINHEIKHVKNKNDFFQALTENSYHLIISDYNLPQYTGIEALKYIREACQYTPFIICTGRINEETAVKCIQLGADDYVLKDDLTRLPSAITKSIESKKNKIQNDLLSAELKSSEENLRAITSNSPDTIYALDIDGNIIFSSEKKDILVGNSIFTLADENYHGLIKAKLDECYSEKKNVSFEIQLNRNKNKKWFSIKMGPILDGEEVSRLVLIPHDITPIKNAEEDLRSLNERLHLLNNHIETVRDEEKKKIALEIHDQLGQELIGNKLGMYWLKQNMTSNNPEVTEKIDDLIDLSSQIINTVRRIAHELRPVVLDDIGILAALEWHVENFNKSSQAFCKIEISSDTEKLSKDVSTTIYRIVQESLTNINKHAQAKNAHIKLEIADKHIHLEISDDGIGVDVKDALNSKSMGIFGMQERLKPYNGNFKLEKLEQGTLITIDLTHND